MSIAGEIVDRGHGGPCTSCVNGPQRSRLPVSRCSRNLSNCGLCIPPSQSCSEWWRGATPSGVSHHAANRRARAQCDSLLGWRQLCDLIYRGKSHL